MTRVLPRTTAIALDLEATHVLLPRQVQLRVLDAVHVHDEAAARCLVREACILEALRHPGIPRVHECGRLEDRRPWLALEALNGPTLADLIGQVALSVSDTLGILRDLAEILHHAHLRGVVHCRIRPAHVVRAPAGLTITGWDGACTYDGTPQSVGELDVDHFQDHRRYVAPELAAAAIFDQAVDARADVYSLGVLAYQALTLAAPDRPIEDHLPTLSRSVAVLVERMTSRVVLARPTAAEVRAEAGRLLELTQDGVEEEVIEIDVTEVDDDAFAVTERPVSSPRGIKWTPTDPYQPQPPATGTPRRRKST